MFLYVANWKMNMPFSKALHFCKFNYDGFLRIHDLPQKKVVLCPEFTVIKPIYDLFEKSYIDIGGQDCSQFAFGNYTGQVASESLKEIGCNYCIVGHSERREYCSETSQEVANKVARLLEVEIRPILCVGETKAEYDAGETKNIIKSQLKPVFDVLQKAVKPKICIAYEPVWSIGTGIVPETKYIEQIFEYIRDLKEESAKNTEIMLLYGGSVDVKTAQYIKKTKHLDGFLIGGASLDFQKFEKIVNL